MSTPANLLPTGQAPAGDQGQAPNPAAPPAAPAAPAAPATPPPAQAAGDPAQPAQPQQPAPAPQAGTAVTDVATLQKLLNAANAEAAANRTKLKAIEDKDKTDLQKAQEALEATSKQNRLLSVQVAAGKLGIVDPEAAAALLPADTPLDQVEAKLTEMLAQRPWLKGQPAAPAAPPNTPPGNPPKATTSLTLEQIKLMSQAEINARWAEVSQVLSAAGKAGQ